MPLPKSPDVRAAFNGVSEFQKYEVGKHADKMPHYALVELGNALQHADDQSCEYTHELISATRQALRELKSARITDEQEAIRYVRRAIDSKSA